MKLAPYDDIESLQRYSQEISKYPLLSPEKEKELVIRASKGDLEARAKLINSNLRLVVYEARRFLYSGLPLLDLISEGNIGLIRAVDHSNPKYKNKFSTYARYWIKQAITQAIRDKVEPVHFPALFYNKKKRLEHIIYSKSNVTSPLEESLLDKSEFSKDFLLLCSPFHGGIGSLNSPIAQDLEVLDVVLASMILLVS